MIKQWGKKQGFHDLKISDRYRNTLSNENYTVWIAGAEFEEPTEVNNMLEENNNEDIKEITKDKVNKILESDYLESNLTSINQTTQNKQNELQEKQQDQ